MSTSKKRVVIMGAAGRDFHDFNTTFRNNPSYEIVAFTATQIPDIDGKVYPAELAGPLYPKGIPILAEADLKEIINKEKIDEVIFSYSDVQHEYVMHKASLVLALGSDFRMLGSNNTQIKSTKPVVSICAARTGCGKSQTTRRIINILKSFGKKVVSIRHPMPYGDIAAQKVQRYASLEDLKKHKCTIEEMEEYEPHIALGSVIYAGVDYEAILREAEKEADIILWDGGNNDYPFYKSDLEVVVVDPLRPGHELRYHPGEVNINRAHVVVINKIDVANYQDVATVRANVQATNPQAVIIEAASPLTVVDYEKIAGKRVLVVEDGPTLTHGEMKIGAGVVAAQKYNAAEIIDPRPFVKGRIAETFKKYPYIGTLLPAMGYGNEQIRDLENTINSIDCDLVIIGTPIDLSRVINIKKPHVRVQYELQEIGTPNLETILRKKFV
ncbi:MAG: GTPase [Oligoflexia bacterium]|nr:GTPase [Oligoflexia bacterium]